MAYFIAEHKLRVCWTIASEKEAALRKARVIILEHILPTTEEFLYLLREKGADIFAVIAKPYSIDPHALAGLQQGGFQIHQHSYSDLEQTTILNDLLRKAIEESERDHKNIIIIDVGGYFARPATTLDEKDRAHFAGIIEDTTFGHNRYLEAVKRIAIPIISVARSELKEIEARFVGRDAVSAMDLILRKHGVSLPGRSALVLGYGMIGKNVARTLKSKDLKVSVYDIEDHKNLAAFIDGYNIHKKTKLTEGADIIFAATGNPSGALSFDEIEDCKDNVILVSVGSKDTEFDIAGLKRQAKSIIDLSSRNQPSLLKQFHLRNGKNVLVAKEGTAINFFLPSIPTEVLDLVFSEILTGMITLLEKHEGFSLNKIHEVHTSTLSIISKIWLRFVNR